MFERSRAIETLAPRHYIGRPNAGPPQWLIFALTNGREARYAYACRYLLLNFVRFFSAHLFLYGPGENVRAFGLQKCHPASRACPEREIILSIRRGY